MEYLRVDSVEMNNQDQMSPLLSAPHHHNDFEEYVTSMCQNPLLSICSNYSTSEIVELGTQDNEATIDEDMPQEFGDLLGEEPLVRQTTQEGRTSDELLSLVTSDH